MLVLVELLANRITRQANGIRRIVLGVLGDAEIQGKVNESLDERDDVEGRQNPDVLGHVDLEALVQLVAPDLGQVVSLGVEEEPAKEVPCVVERRRLTGALLLEHLDDSLFLAGRGVFLEGVRDVDGVLEQCEDAFVRGGIDLEASRRILFRKSSEQRRDRQLALPVDTGVHDALLVDLELEPGPAGRHQVRGEDLLRRILWLHQVGAWAPDELGDDHPFGAVDDERALIGHHREVAHEDRLFPDLARVLVHEPDHHRERCLVGEILLAALGDRELGRPELVRTELHRERTGVVLDRRDVVDRLPEAFLHEPLEGRLLDIDEVRHVKDVLETGKRCALRASGDLTGQLAATSLGQRQTTDRRA